MTSSTSGKAPVVLATSFSPHAPKEMANEGHARMLTCSGSLGIRLANVLVASRVPAGTALRVLPLDHADVSDGLQGLLEDFSPAVLNGVPSYIARVVPYFSASAQESVRKIVSIGETLTEYQEELFRERFPRAQQHELYIANDAGGHVGARTCGFLPRNHFHPAKGVEVAIDAPDEKGFGDILVTKELPFGLKLECYRIGDRGRLAAEPCACGAPVTLELAGRAGVDYIKLAGALLRREEFDRVAARFREMIRDYRVEAREAEEGGALRGEVVLTIYYPGGNFTEALVRELSESISRALFLTPSKTLADLVREGAYRPLVLRVRGEPFPQDRKDVRLRLVSR